MEHKYYSLNEEFLKEFQVTKEIWQIINKHESFFHNKNIDEIMKFAWFADHEKHEDRDLPSIESAIYVKLKVLHSKLPPEIMQELNGLQNPPDEIEQF